MTAQDNQPEALSAAGAIHSTGESGVASQCPLHVQVVS